MPNSIINDRTRYGNSSHVAMVAKSNFVFKIAAKPLQIEAWLLLTA